MIYKLYAAPASTADGVAQLDIMNDGIITCVLFAMCVNGADAHNDVARIEVSFMSSNTFGTNDTRGSIAMLCASQQFLTSGGGIGFPCFSIPGLDIPVSAGERLYMHALVGTGVVATTNVYLYVSDKASSLRPPVRRR